MTACSNPDSSTSIAIPRRSVGQVRHCGYHRLHMTDVDSYDELALPNGAEVLGVFVNGVPLVAGQDYDVMADRIHLTNPVRRRTSVSTVGKVLLTLGVGVYNKGDVVDVQVRRGNQTQVMRGRRFGEQS